MDKTQLEAVVKSGQVPFSAWVYLGEDKEGEARWTLLAEVSSLRKLHPEYEASPKAAPRKAEPAAALPKHTWQADITGAASVSAEPVWFVIRNKKKFGPYAAPDIIAQLQRKELSGSSFVWRPGFPTWQRMSGVSEFAPEMMRRLLGGSDNMDILIRRKSPRAPYKVDVIAHDNKNVIEGQSMVIGEGGLFLAHENPRHKVGTRLKIHFRDADLSAFNAVAEVVSVTRTPLAGYCLRFVAISEADRKKISKYITGGAR